MAFCQFLIIKFIWCKCLLSHLYKLFTKILQNRLKKELDAQQPREQAGFREGFSTTDHLHAINQLIEKSNEYQLDLCIGFIDYEKAFDSIEHLNLFQALREIGINEGYVCILEDIYTDATSRIHLDSDGFWNCQDIQGSKTRRYFVTKGVHSSYGGYLQKNTFGWKRN